MHNNLLNQIILNIKHIKVYLFKIL